MSLQVAGFILSRSGLVISSYIMVIALETDKFNKHEKMMSMKLDFDFTVQKLRRSAL